MSENVGASTSRNPKGLHGLYRDNFTFLPYLSSDTIPKIRPNPPSSLALRNMQFFFVEGSLWRAFQTFKLRNSPL
jgi:hypothetical protein